MKTDMSPSDPEKSSSQWTERDSLVQARNRTKRTLINKAYEYFQKCKADVYLYIHYENKYFIAEFFRDSNTTSFQLLNESLKKVYPPPL
ncbi:hypothetical protein, variant [Blastomyces gilchristii SLH14081]|uniref:MADS-box domain-containing protein n=1 Tax=Blastomyces gilchristii (strain SLH14081) TaxID=559298 RepID=A0A179UTZ4_BLAGS|nr:hypothetical protein, variant [Blastomyces gilchristii SLH14081]OAT10511.1 hypothetical protein, variant [Blastomyces gilchristii SLH14081]